MLDAFPAVAYLKTIIQALHHYIITIWAGRNAALHAQNQDTTKLAVHDIRRLCKLKGSFPDSAKVVYPSLHARRRG